MVLTVQKTIVILQLQYIDQVIDVGFAGRAVPRCCRGGDSRAPTIAAAQVPQLQYFFVVDVPVVQVHLGVQFWTRLSTCPLLCNDRVFSQWRWMSFQQFCLWRR